MSGRVFGYTFGRVPTWLLDEAVSDRSIRLFALLTRYADREGRGFPGRRTLAERLRCVRAATHFTSDPKWDALRRQ